MAKIIKVTSQAKNKISLQTKKEKKIFPFLSKICFFRFALYFIISLFFALLGLIFFFFNVEAFLFWFFISLLFLLLSIPDFVHGLLILIYARKHPKTWENNPWCIHPFKIMFSKKTKFSIRLITIIFFLIAIAYAIKYILIKFIF